MRSPIITRCDRETVWRRNAAYWNQYQRHANKGRRRDLVSNMDREGDVTRWTGEGPLKLKILVCHQWDTTCEEVTRCRCMVKKPTRIVYLHLGARRSNLLRQAFAWSHKYRIVNTKHAEPQMKHHSGVHGSQNLCIQRARFATAHSGCKGLTFRSLCVACHG